LLFRIDGTYLDVILNIFIFLANNPAIDHPNPGKYNPSFARMVPANT